MSVVQRGLVFAFVFAAGMTAGGFLVHLWHRGETPPRRWEATVLLPVQANDGRRFTRDEWDGAVGVFAEAFGGATLGAEQEGCWHDGKRVQREPVRPVVVSFERHRLGEFRAAAREAGRRLGQQVVYVRFEEPGVELLTVTAAEKER